MLKEGINRHCKAFRTGKTEFGTIYHPFQEIRIKTREMANIGSSRKLGAFCTFGQILVYCKLGTLSSKL